MLEKKDIELLKVSKNLLAFSGGADSTALFFLLEDNYIEFDIAIVDYSVRKQSKKEVAYAKDLALKYDKACFIMQAEKIYKNFEAQARTVRYNFFQSLIRKYSYTTLLTAHHLGDRLEWFLMQLSKGAGCAELNSLKKLTQNNNYILLRPLLHVTKDELIFYLKNSNRKWFEDITNQDITIKRNEFRHLHVEPLLQKYTDGIKRSFQYIDYDTKKLVQEIVPLHVKELYYFKQTKNNIYHIDKILKKFGIMISKNVRDEIANSKETIISRKYLICKIKDYILIAPFIQNINMNKQFKEKCRILGITPKLRLYLYKNQDIFIFLKKILNDKHSL